MNKRISNIPKANAHSLMAALACASMFCIMLGGCGSTSSNDVWNNYDYRNAAPAVDGGSNDSSYSAPQGYGAQNGGYQDNDAGYSAPQNCAPGSPDLCF